MYNLTEDPVRKYSTLSLYDQHEQSRNLFTFYFIKNSQVTCKSLVSRFCKAYIRCTKSSPC